MGNCPPGELSGYGDKHRDTNLRLPGISDDVSWGRLDLDDEGAMRVRLGTPAASRAALEWPHDPHHLLHHAIQPTVGHILHKRRMGVFAVCDESGHADNPATFAPCVKSMTADFNRKILNVPHGGLPYNFVR